VGRKRTSPADTVANLVTARELWPIDEAAARLSMHRVTLYRPRNAGEIAFVKCGRRSYVTDAMGHSRGRAAVFAHVWHCLRPIRSGSRRRRSCRLGYEAARSPGDRALAASLRASSDAPADLVRATHRSADRRAMLSA